MTTNNQNESVNHIPFLSEEMERTLRRLAWKDEDFREALIADPKGIIQQVFPHCFPDGKVPDDLTINVVEQDPSAHYIVIPSLPDQFPALEIPEEPQLELIAHRSDRVTNNCNTWGNCRTNGCHPGKHGEVSEHSDSKPEGKLKRDFIREQVESQSKKGKRNEVEEGSGWSRGESEAKTGKKGRDYSKEQYS